jgi:hypothetical protein
MKDGLTHLTEEERQSLADGTIAADRGEAARAHLRGCAACADDVARLERLTMRARQLEEPTDELGALWPGIRSRIERAKVVPLAGEPAGGAHGRRRVLAMVAAAAMLVVAALLAERSSVRTGAPGGGPVASDTAASMRFIDDSVRVYREEAQMLMNQLELTRSMLDPTAAAAIDKDLAVVDSAIDELQTALVRDPRNPALQRLLATSYREKIEVLKRVSNAG